MLPQAPLYNEAAVAEDPATGGASAATTAATTAPLIGADGAFGENWHTALGDEFSPHSAQLGTFKNVAGLAKSYLHLRSTGPAYPGEGATDDDISRYRSLAQVPSEGTPMGYGIQLPTELSPAEQGMYDRISKVAHGAHVSGPGLKAIIGEYQKIQGEIQSGFDQEAQAQQKAAVDQLIGKWGKDFEANKSTARHMISTLADEAGISPDVAGFTELMNNPLMAQMAYAMAQRVAEDGTRLPSGYSDMRSPQQRAKDIMSGKDSNWGKKYTEGSTEDRLAAYNEVGRLMKMR